MASAPPAKTVDVGATSRLVSTYETLNFELTAKQRRCFFEDVSKDQMKRNVNIFVQEGGDMEVLFSVHGPMDLEKAATEDFDDPILTENVNPKKEKVSESQVVTVPFEAPQSGLFAFCVDNRQARFFSKLVQVDIQTPPKNDIHLDVKGKAEDTEEIKNALKSLGKIHKGILNIQHQQQRDRHRLALHSASNLLNYDRVFYGSLFETAVFIVVALFQIFFVRRWFASKVSSKSRK